MEKPFVHLHVHTQYSLLEGALRVKPLIERAKAFGMPAVAMTDSNNLFGAIDFTFAAQAAGLKPILGAELRYAPRGRFSGPSMTGGAAGLGTRDYRPSVFHLTALCLNHQGYQNLCRLLSEAYEDAWRSRQEGKKGFDEGVVDAELLKRYSEGLIILSGCLKSSLSYQVLQGEEDAAREELKWFQSVFGDRFYVELQDLELPEQVEVNKWLHREAEVLGVRAVVTSNCHYLNPEDAQAQEVLQSIEYNRRLDLDRPESLVPKDFYFKSPEQMWERMAAYPDALTETVTLAERIDLQFKFKDASGKQIYHLPEFRPDGVSKEDAFDPIEYFRSQCWAGLDLRFKEASFRSEHPRQEYEDRMRMEIEVIEKTGFSGYFLIVSDFIRWAKREGIPVGPGRGSGAGSVVAWALEITDLDPVDYDLLFERFLNPERISMPDFDVDFCQDRRGEVIDYVVRKYGADKVCQIITFGKLQAKAAIKDVGRVFGLSFAETDRITKLFPDELNISIAKAVEKSPDLRTLIESDRSVEKVVDYALKLEGLYRNPGVHAAGVIITEEPVVQYCPLFVGSEGVRVTQFDKDYSEKIGLVKFDFLGLKTLTVIDNAVKLVHLSEPFDLKEMPYDDAAVFELIGSGDTDGVFQVESSGMKDLCSRLQPSSVGDLTAINALYRPGPLGSGMVDDFIDRKHGRKPIEYELPELEPILKDTYGVILYQEQVMQIARTLAGYSLGQADMLRRAMGKKKPEEMAYHREIFLKGARERNIPEEKAESVFNLMAKFAEYGFNKSHSAAYAVLTYQTAYLKAHYPSEFMAALMTTEMHNTDKLSKYIADAKAHRIPILPPSVNLSQEKFSVEWTETVRGKEKGIRFGLAAIKGVGGSAVEALLQSREGRSDDERRGPFMNVVDFSKRVSTRRVNKKVLEALITAGAFDDIAEANRPSLLASLEGILSHAADEQEERALGQSSLFDSFTAEEVKAVTQPATLIKSEADWTLSQKLTLEKQVVGFYVSGHPMDQWQDLVEGWLGTSTEKLKEIPKNTAAPAATGEPPRGRPQRPTVRLAGVMTEIREKITKRGTKMAFTEIEDLHGKIEVIVFPDAYQKLSERLQVVSARIEPICMTAELGVEEDNVKLFLQDFEELREVHHKRVNEVVLHLETEHVSVDMLRALKKTLLGVRGKVPVMIRFSDPYFRTEMRLPDTLAVSGSPQTAAEINALFGRSVVEMR